MVAFVFVGWLETWKVTSWSGSRLSVKLLGSVHLNIFLNDLEEKTSSKMRKHVDSVGSNLKLRSNQNEEL